MDEASELNGYLPYMSMADLKHSPAYDIATLGDHTGQEVITELHAEVVALG